MVPKLGAAQGKDAKKSAPAGKEAAPNGGAK
jgi:hypothetical protein